MNPFKDNRFTIETKFNSVIAVLNHYNHGYVIPISDLNIQPLPPVYITIYKADKLVCLRYLTRIRFTVYTIYYTYDTNDKRAPLGTARAGGEPYPRVIRHNKAVIQCTLYKISPLQSYDQSVAMRLVYCRFKSKKVERVSLIY